MIVDSWALGDGEKERGERIEWSGYPLCLFLNGGETERRERSLLRAFFSFNWSVKRGIASSLSLGDFAHNILASRYTRRTKSMPSPTLEPCTQPRMTDSLTKQQHGQHERRRNFQLYISLIVEHATRCDSPSCQSFHCQKMKFYQKHGLVCTNWTPFAEGWLNCRCYFLF